jgi:hypothetical protein
MKGYRELVDFQFPSFSNLSLNRVSAETSLFQLLYLNFKQASDAGYFDRTEISLARSISHIKRFNDKLT